MRNLLLLALLLPAILFSQSKKLVSFPSAYGNGTQQVGIYEPANLLTGLHAVLICANGIGEMNTTNNAANSIGDQLDKGKAIPGDFIVAVVYKPNDGNGEFQPSRFKDAVDWVLKTYPTADPSRVYVTGLSQGGGGVLAAMADSAFSKKVAAFAPVAGTGDASDAALLAGINASKTPFRIYGSVKDDNPPTQSEFSHLLAVVQWADPTGILNKNGTFIDTQSGHGGTWAYAYNFTSSDLFKFFLSKSRPELAKATPVIVSTNPPAKTIYTTIGIYKTDGSLLCNITVYSDGTAVSSTK